MTYKFQTSLYSKKALFKAAYSFTDKAYIHIDLQGKYYVVNIEMKDSGYDIEEKDFQNEILAQMVRCYIRSETENIRELIMARAFASTVIEDVEKEQEPLLEADNVDIRDVLRDWFEKYE